MTPKRGKHPPFITRPRKTDVLTSEKSAIRRVFHRLLTPEQRRFVKFGVVGASGVIVNLAFVWLALGVMTHFGLAGEAGGGETLTQQAVASAIGILISVFTNFLLNDCWTWGDRGKETGRGALAARIFRYYLASGAAVLIQYGTVMAMLYLWDTNIYLGQLAGIALGTLINFAINNFWTFRETPQSDPPAS